ncbi:MAG: dioxygenase [Pseudanabaena sp. Salubria-1]|nr:dioxygenase [Pseudanabaena sp. Salubria-1]
MDSLPTIFLSHGAPDLAIRDGAVSDFLRSLHQQFPKPKAILVISAHWNSDPPMVSAATNPRTIYDFSGFPSQLYELSYLALGSPELSDRVVELLTQAGMTCETHPTRGLDHGAWTPLLLAYPAADIPVTQLSIQSYRDPLHHWQIGKALEPLRHEGVLIIGSGSATHNMYAFNESYNAETPDWVRVFDQWLAQNIAEGNQEALLQYRQRAPYAKENHPTDEHLMPLFVAMGAGGVKGKQLHSSYTYGVFSMAAYAFMS